MNPQTKGVDVPPSLRGKELADMTAVELQSVVYAQRDSFAKLIEAATAYAAAEEDLANREINGINAEPHD